MNAEAIEKIKSLQEKNNELERLIERFQCEKNELLKEKDLLKEHINDLLRRLYGRKTERFENPNQTDLLKELGWPEEENKPETRERDLQSVSYTRKRPRKYGPKPLPEHLPREVIRVDPKEEERACGFCSKDMERVDEVVTEELVIVPPQLRVKQYVQGKWRCVDCMNQDKVEPLPPRPIEKGRPSPSLLAYIVVSKYADHLPLNRQEQIFKRHGIHLVRSTMDEWLGQLSHLLLPIISSMRRRFLLEPYIQLDETPMDALEHEGRKKKGKKKKQIRRCYLWAYSIPRDEVVYDVTPSRSMQGPKAFLEGFTGILQTDGYPAFDGLFKMTGRISLACMAHIRRKFFEARHAAPERVERILDLIRGLYAIEEKAREENLDPEARRQLRDKEARPIFLKLKSEIDELAPIPVPKSKLGKAVSYAISEWPAMERYLDLGEVEIDNNWCEQAIRPAVLGRNNYLFFGSLNGGGRRAQVFYSLVQSCKRLKINPFTYLSDVIERVSTHPAARIDELTPRGWKKIHGTAENTLS